MTTGHCGQSPRKKPIKALICLASVNLVSRVRKRRTTVVAQFSCLVCTPGHTAALGRVATTYIIFCTLIKLKHTAG